MNINEIRSTARQMTIEAIMPSLMDNDAVKFGDGSFAILQRVDGEEVWCEISVKTKAFRETKRGAAFDPYEAAEVWQKETEIKAAEKERKAAEKADKIARDEAKRAKEKEA